ncbi:DUF2894 domain-containing protein [Paraburkholderia sp. T12-10]|nr:DUF2894 domain-containing protein [Paraburkholderia sp. T12-10]
MSNEASRAHAMLDAWREQGADRVDPVRFRFIEAMARRAAGHNGEVQRVLENKLSELIRLYSDAVANAAPKAGESANANANANANETLRHKPPRSSLGALTDYIASHARAACGDSHGTKRITPQPSAYPELPVLDDFREIWSRLSTQRQLRQSLAQVPGNAGPLNSSSLVHRSLSLMQAVSPGYLQQFLSYVDALSWIEQMHATLPADKTSARSGKSGDVSKKARRGPATK